MKPVQIELKAGIQTIQWEKDRAKACSGGYSSDILDVNLAIKLIHEGRIERTGQQACGNLPFQIVTVVGNRVFVAV